MALNRKQKRFVDEYCIDLNATRAAIRAGYSAKTAGQIGEQNLKKLEIKNAVDAALKKIHAENVASAQEVERYLTSVMRGESRSEIVVIENTGDYQSKARNVMKAPDEKERLKAAELLGKRHRLFTDNVSLEGGIHINFTGEGELED